VRHDSVGRTKIFSTTEKFQKYFGVSGEDLRAHLFSKGKGRRAAAPSPA